LPYSFFKTASNPIDINGNITIKIFDKPKYNAAVAESR